MRSFHARSLLVGAGALALLALSPPLAAQTLEGSRWSIEQEGMDTAVIWWLGSEGRVRTGDLGIILPAYHWRQSGDSVFITVGDSIKYAAMLMSNRLVGGIRSGRNRQEGWWSGTLADPAAPAALATASTPAPSTPASTPAGVQPMSRPADSTATMSPAVVVAPGGRRPLRRIIRSEAPSGQAAPVSGGDGREIRRIERTDNAQNSGSTLPAIMPVDASGAPMVGSWVRADSVGVVEGFDLAGDGTVAVHLRNGATGNGQWTSDNEGTKITFRGPEGGEVRLVVWPAGPGLRGAIVTAAGPRRTLAFRRAPAGPAREPAVRQP